MKTTKRLMKSFRLRRRRRPQKRPPSRQAERRGKKRGGGPLSSKRDGAKQRGLRRRGSGSRPRPTRPREKRRQPAAIAPAPGRVAHGGYGVSIVTRFASVLDAKSPVLRALSSRHTRKPTKSTDSRTHASSARV